MDVSDYMLGPAFALIAESAFDEESELDDVEV